MDVIADGERCDAKAIVALQRLALLKTGIE